MSKNTYSKPLPSLQFVQLAKNISAKDQTKKNTYDTKNHTLTIGNWENFANVLKNQHNRSIESFQRQLKMLGFKKKVSQIGQPQPKQKIEQVQKKSEVSRFNQITKNINVFTPTKQYKNQDASGNFDFKSARQKQRNKDFIQERPITSCFSGFKKVESLKQGKNQQSGIFSMNPYPYPERKKSNFDKVQQPQKISKSETVINLSLLLSDFQQPQTLQRNIKIEEPKEQFIQKIQQKKKNEIVYYIWRGNKQLLINKKISSFESCLRKKIDNSQQLLASIKKKRERMDKLMENLIFNMMLNGQETGINIQQKIDQEGNTGSPLRNAILMRKTIQQMRNMVNEVQLKSNVVGSDISDILANQLDLYRMLIYKEKQKISNTVTIDNAGQQQQS